MTEFMRPTVTTEEVNDTVARFIVEPLERGYGYTLGNCMRRVLLSSLDGAKATAIQIEGVQHEFTTAEGVIEDITDIVLNVKGLVFSALNDDIEEATAHVSAEGPCTVTGADLDIPTEFTLVNPEHVIATVADGGQLDMTVRIGVGRGYVSAERNKRTEDPIGVIHVDSLFSPVRRCTLNVTDTRVGQRTDYDKLVLEVETDGSITPTEAVCRASNIINQYMGAFLSLSDVVDEEEGEIPSIFAPEGQESNAELDKQIEDLDLSVRIMRHNYKGRKLGTDFSHTKAMKKSLVNALFLNDRIKTVESRAKEIRPNVDKIITWAKKGDLHSRRLAIAALGDKELVREIFEKVEQGMFADRQGGYTRIMKLGNRKGDNAPMVIMELVTEPVKKKEEPKPAAKKATKKAAPKKVEAAEEAPKEEAAEAKAEEAAVEVAEKAEEAAAENAEAAEVETADAKEEEAAK